MAARKSGTERPAKTKAARKKAARKKTARQKSAARKRLVVSKKQRGLGPDEVKRIIAELQKRGFRTPYLRNYVVARINPVRFHRAKKGESEPPMPMSAALTRMAASAKKFDTAAVREGEVALVAAASGGSDG